MQQVKGNPPVAAPATLRVALIDRRIEAYIKQQLSRRAILEHLLAARWPLEQLRPRFPEFPEAAFRHPEIPAPVAGPAAPTQPISPRSSLPSVANPFVDHALQKAVTAAEGISFQYVPLIQCSFPHADPKDATTFTRKNGWLELTLSTTRPDAGLPYGVPARLLTIYCTSEAVRTNSPEIYLGDSVHDFLRRLDVPITRGARGSLSVYANQLLRLIRSTLTIDENIKGGAGRSGLHIRQALFVEEAQLWWDEPEGRVGNGSSLVLSSVLFHSILERSAPLATSAIKQLRKSPMDLDVYAWLVHRLFHLNKPSMVSWSQLSDQFGHSYREPRTFRRFFLDSLKRVSAVYPDAKLKISDAGILLLPSRPHLAGIKTQSKP
jgi:Plasmid encoded RepA protein